MMLQKGAPMTKVFSVRRRLIRYFSFLLAVTLMLLLAFGAYSNWAYDRQLRYCADAALGLQSTRLVSETARLSTFCRQLTASNPDFRRLASSSLDDYTAIPLLYRVQNMMESAVPDAGLILLCGSQNSVLRYAYGPEVLGVDRMIHSVHISAAHFLRDRCLQLAEEALGQWFLLETESYVFLCTVYRYHDLRICAALELNTIAQAARNGTEEGVRLLFDQSGRFLTDQAYAAEKKLVPENAYGFRPFFQNYVLTHEELPALGLGLSVLMPVRSVWQYSRLSLLLLAAVAAVCVAVFFLIYRMMRQILITPLQQISSLSRQLSDVREEQVPQILGAEPVEELNTLRESINSLAAQKVHLQKKRDDEETEKEHALLQYYQLQTRSHFFLNCLKSLYSMLETRQFSRMQEMIIAFSNHLRFIFHDNLSLVPLQAEMDEVRDYHRIISMDSSQPLVLTQDISPEALQGLVPPLMVQTFLENSYKYNGRGREVLRFSIRIDRLDYEGSPRLRVRLSDDGLGYPQEALEALNSAVPSDAFEQYHVGIRNLRRRMAILFSGDYELAFFNGPSGGANVLISIPFHEEEGEAS